MAAQAKFPFHMTFEGEYLKSTFETLELPLNWTVLHWQGVTLEVGLSIIGERQAYRFVPIMSGYITGSISSTSSPTTSLPATSWTTAVRYTSRKRRSLRAFVYRSSANTTLVKRRSVSKRYRPLALDNAVILMSRWANYCRRKEMEAADIDETPTQDESRPIEDETKSAPEIAQKTVG
jgi:hypothetical protein